MPRKVLIGSALALVILVVAVFLFLRGSGAPDEGDDFTESPATATGPGDDASTDPGSATLVASKDGDDAAADDEIVLDEVPPLLTGRVVGEGVGIAGADVRFYPVTEIEKLLWRFERLIPQGMQMPDIPALIDAARNEMARFRTLGTLVTTNEDGEFALPNVEPGGYIALTIAEGWLFRYGDVVSLSREDPRELVIELDRAASIHGVVLASTGEAVAGATVVAEYHPPGMAGVGKIVRRVLRMVNGEFLKGPFEATTNADGRFALDSLPPGFYDLAASTRGGVETRLELVETGTEGAVVVLGDAAAIEGAFVDADGQPLAGIVAKLERTDDRIELPMIAAGFSGFANTINQYIGEVPRTITSDDDGRFAFGALGEGKYRLTVAQPGFLELGRDVQVEWGDRHDMGAVRLDRGRMIEGFVYSLEDDAPVEGAVVLGFPAKPNLLTIGTVVNDVAVGRLQVQTDADGRFVLGGLLRADYQLVVTRGGFAPDSRKVPKGTTEPVEFRLEPGITVKGRVVSAEDDEPLAGIRVNSEGVRTKTDVDGRFVLEGVAPRRRPGMENPFAGFRSMGGMGRPRPAEASPGGEAAGGTETEEPVEPPIVQISVRAEGKGWIGQRKRFPIDEIPEEVELEVTKAPAVRGIVFDPNGDPAPGTLVRLTPALPRELDDIGFVDPALLFLGVTVSDLEGRFEFDQLFVGPGGRFRVIGDHVMYARGYSEPFPIGTARFGRPGGDGEDVATEKAASDGEDQLVEVHLVEGASVRGKITDGSQPISGAVIRLARTREQRPEEQMFVNMLGLPPGGTVVHSNSEGEFAYRNILAGDYTVSAEVPGFTEPEPIQIVAAAGETTEVTFEVDPGGVVFGRVEGADGDPIADATVRLLKAEGVSDRMRQAQRFLGGAYKRVMTEADGSFQIEGLPDATYALVAEKAGFKSVDLDGVTASKKGYALVLARAAVLRGSVVDAASGVAVTSFRVSVLEVEADGAGGDAERTDADARRMRRWTARRSYNDVDGHFRRDGLAPGVYRIEVAATGFVPASAELDLFEGEVTERQFALARAGRIDGRVVDKLTGQPIEGAVIEVVPSPADDGAAQGTSRRGPEKSRVARVGDDPKPGAAAVEPDPKAEDDRAIREYFLRGSRNEEAVTAADGSYAVETVRPGRQLVTVSHPDYIQARLDGVEVGFGEALELPVGLEPGLHVAGVVRDAEGEPAGGVGVFLRGVDQPLRRVRKAVEADDDGRFRINGLEAGTYRLFGATRGEDRLTAVQLRVDSSRTDVDLVVSEPPE